MMLPPNPQLTRALELSEQLRGLSQDEQTAKLRAIRQEGREDHDVLSLVSLNLRLPPEPDRDRSGEKIGKFTLERRLAVGGMGEVYSATEDIGRGRPAAVKLIHPALIATAPQLAVAHFEQEIDNLARLDHPHIAKIYRSEVHRDPDTRDETLYFAMQLVRSGLPITAYAAEHNLGMQERLELFRDVCDAIKYAHTQHIVHRDLKPDNILVDVTQHLFVIDFGLAQTHDALLAPSSGHFILGTPAYMSPEQILAEGAEVGVLSDVYSLGVVLFELLAHKRPYEVPSHGSRAEIHAAILRSPPPRLPNLAQADRNALDQIITKTLARQPEARYESVAVLQSAIERYIKVLSGPSPGAYLYLGDGQAARAVSQGSITTDTTGSSVEQAADSLRDLMQEERYKKHVQEFLEARKTALFKESQIGDIWIYDTQAFVYNYILDKDNPLAEHYAILYPWATGCVEGCLNRSEFIAFLSEDELFCRDSVTDEWQEEITELLQKDVLHMAVAAILSGSEEGDALVALCDVSDIKGQLGPRTDREEWFGAEPDVIRRLQELDEHPNTMDLMGSYYLATWRYKAEFLDAWNAL